MNTEYKQHVLGLLKAEGPCTLGRIIHELIDQAAGPWEDAPNRQAKRYTAQLTAVECLNELCREGKAELYDTGDAWDARYEET